MIMMIFSHAKDTLQIMATNKQQSPNLRMPVESYQKLISSMQAFSPQYRA